MTEKIKIGTIDKDIYNKHFKFDSKDNFVNYDINIFKELKEKSELGLFKTKKHKTFTFGYIWLVSYLWKYSKYGQAKYDTDAIKSILGLNEKDSRVDYIIKRDGLLDEWGYTEATRDFPIATAFENNSLRIYTLEDIGENERRDFLRNYGNRYYCKKPIHQFEREDKTGLMFSKDDVFRITRSEFIRAALTKEIGCEGLYLYAYIKLKLKMSVKNNIVIYNNELKETTGFCDATIRRLTKNLEFAGMIKKETVAKNEGGKLTKTNSYSIVFQDSICSNKK